MASRFSFGKIKDTLASIGHKISKPILIDYMAKIESAFLAFQIPIYSYSVKDQLQYPRKIYIVDLAVSSKQSTVGSRQSASQQLQLTPALELRNFLLSMPQALCSMPFVRMLIFYHNI